MKELKFEIVLSYGDDIPGSTLELQTEECMNYLKVWASDQGAETYSVTEIFLL